MIPKDLLEELKAQLESHENVMIVSEGSGNEIPVTDVQFDSINDAVVIYAQS